MSVERRLREGWSDAAITNVSAKLAAPPGLAHGSRSHRAGTRYMERVNPGTDEFWRCLRSCARAVAAGASSR